MCGIFSAFITGHIDSKLRGQIRDALMKTAHRGHDGWGYMHYRPDYTGPIVYRSLDPEPKESEIQQLVDRLVPGSRFIFNVRAAPVTEGGVTYDNLHPFTNGEWYAVHNGIITNDAELRNELNDPKINANVDSAILPTMRSKYDAIEIPEKLIGGFSIAMLSRSGELEIYRNYKTLYQSTVYGKMWAVASEAKALQFSGAVISEFPKECVVRVHRKESPMPGHTHIINPVHYTPMVTVMPFKAQYMSHVPDMNDDEAAVIISGGMDSSLVAFIAGRLWSKKVHLIHFNYRQKSSGMEREAVRAVYHKLLALGVRVELEIIDLEWLGHLGASPLTDDDIAIPLGRESSKSSLCWTPARNLVMLSLAAAYCEANGVKHLLYGSNLEEEGPSWKDNDAAAVDAFENAMFYGTLGGVKVTNVLGRLMKRDIVQAAHELGVPMESTCSCDQPTRIGEPVFEMPESTFNVKREPNWQACGVCGCCMNRRHAYIQCGIDDPQSYTNDPKELYSSVDAVGKEFNTMNILHRLRSPRYRHLPDHDSTYELVKLAFGEGV